MVSFFELDSKVVLDDSVQQMQEDNLDFVFHSNYQCSFHEED